MTALVTGASSGIGRDIARVLISRGWDVILVARRAERLTELKKDFGKHAKCIRCDVSNAEGCKRLYEATKDDNVEMLVNCAGFGLFGEFVKTDLDVEIKMIETNITAVHILTKLFLRDFTEKDRGFILNVASVAGFMSGPLMAAYYATKNYVVSLTGAIYEELKQKNSKVKISVLCPGPVATEFNDVANVTFASPPLESMTVAKTAVDGLMKGKLIIIPGVKMKLVKFARRVVPDKELTHFCYYFQKSKK